jgi:dihydrofolate reductase
MRKIVISEFMSLDGVFEAPGPDGSGYKFEGWTMQYGNEEFMNFKMEELRHADTQLLGRITYEGFAKAWPERTGDEFSDKFNSMPKYVVSKTLEKAEWNNSHIIKGDVAKEIARLKEEEGQDILVAGSGKLVNFLLEMGLADELRLLVFPVILGTGRRLFKGTHVMLKLLESIPFQTGVVALKYEPVQ